MNRKVVCGIYTRVSTDNQAEKEYNSCQSQREKIDHFIKSQKDFSVFDYYSDEGFSGKDLNRPAMQRMLQAVVMGKINCIVTYKIDRLTRSPKNFYQLIEVFENYKVDFISVTERFDTATPSGRLLRNIMLTFAQFERELASERTRDKMLQRAEKGMWNGGFVPFGYRKENKELVVDKRESEILRKIYDVYIDTGSLGEIVQFLKKRKMRDRKGNFFSKSTIFFALRNVVYTGKIKYGGGIYQGRHEALITDEIFKEAQTRHNRAYSKVRKYREVLFPGLVRCSECGSIMTTNYTSKRTKGRTKRYYYYRCTSTLKKGWDACSTKQVSMDRLEKFVVDALKRVYHDEYYLQSILTQINDKSGFSSFSEEEAFSPGERMGIGKRMFCSGVTPEIFRRSLQNTIKAAEKRTPGFSAELMKNSFESILYGKEVIKLRMLLNVEADNKAGEGEQGRDEAVAHPDFKRGCATDVPRRTAEGSSAGGHPKHSEKQDSSRARTAVRVGGISHHLYTKKEPDHFANDPVRIFSLAPRVRLELTT